MSYLSSITTLLNTVIPVSPLVVKTKTLKGASPKGNVWVSILMTLGGGEVEGMVLRSVVFNTGYTIMYLHRVLKLLSS